MKTVKNKNVYNQLEECELILDSCPDEEPKTKGDTPEKPDLFFINAKTDKGVAIEVKKLFHGFSSDKKNRNKDLARYHQYPRLQSIVTEILHQMIDLNQLSISLFDEYSVALFIKGYIKDDYFESNFRIEFQDFANDFLSNSENNTYENDCVRISFDQNYPFKTFGTNNILFQMPANYDDERKGISIGELFDISNDFLTVYNEIVRLIEENTHKFDNYPNEKTIFLFILTPKMGLDLFQNFMPQNGIHLFEGLASKKNAFTRYTFVDSMYLFCEDFTDVNHNKHGQIEIRTVDILYDLKEATKRIMLYQ